MFSFIRYTSLWFIISALIIVVGFGAAGVWGLNFGLDFKGGSLLEAEFAKPTTVDHVTTAFQKVETTDSLLLGVPAVTPVGDGGTRYVLKFHYLEDEASQQKLVAGLKREIGEFTVDKFTTAGPKLGDVLKQKALRALTYVSIAIVLYLAATFRNRRTDTLTKYIAVGTLLGLVAIACEVMDVSSLTRWVVFAVLVAIFLAFLFFELRASSASLKFGLCAIVALLHDVAIVIGFYAIAGHFIGVEVDGLAVTALLTVMGFSVHDTIVVFDRLRENLKFQKTTDTLAVVADKSLRQTLARSINTSMTALITLTCLFFFGADSTKWFVAALIIGITVGTYSSIFVATPLYVLWQKKS